jgi:hypothetical protein
MLEADNCAHVLTCMSLTTLLAMLFFSSGVITAHDMLLRQYPEWLQPLL